VEDGGLLDLSGTAAIQAASGAPDGFTMVVEGDLNIDGTAEGAGVTLTNIGPGGIIIGGTGTISVLNVTIASGADGAAMVIYARADNLTFTGVEFPDTSFGTGSNVLASGGGTLTIVNTSVTGDGWGEDFDNDSNGSVVWQFNSSEPPPTQPQLVVAVGGARPANFSAINNAQGVVIGQWVVSAQNGSGAVAGFTFSASGSADETTALTRLRLFLDTNGNGTREASEAQLGASITNFSGGAQSAAFSFTALNLAAGSSMYVILVADFAGTAAQGDTIVYSLSSSSAVVSTIPSGGSEAAPVTGEFPIDSSLVVLGITALPRIGALTLGSTSALAGATGLTASTTVKNVGGSTLNLTGATLRAIAGGTTTTLTTSVTFSPASIAPAAASAVTLTFALPGGIVAGTYVIDLEVTGTDAGLGVQVSDNTASPPASLTVISGLSITTVALPRGTAGKSYTGFVAASGGLAPVSVTLAGTLPSGLSFDGALVMGIPLEEGSFTVTATAADSSGLDVSAEFTIEIDPAPPTTPSDGGSSGGDAGDEFLQNASIFTDQLPNALLGQKYGQSLSGAPDGGTWSVFDGALPDGISLSEGKGDLSGTPTVAGEFDFVIRLDAGGSFATKAFTIIVFTIEEATVDNPPPPFGGASGLNLIEASSPSLIAGLVNEAQVSAATVSGDAPLNYVDIISDDEAGPQLADAFYFDTSGDGQVSAGDLIRVNMNEQILLGTGEIGDFGVDGGSLGTDASLTAAGAGSSFEILLGDGAGLIPGESELLLFDGASVRDVAGNFGVASSVTIGNGLLSTAGITLITLNGEPVEEFTTAGIEWQTNPNESDWTIDIDLLQHGAAMAVIAAGISDSGRFDWSVPGGMTGSGYSIRITGHNATLEEDYTDESLETFTIAAAGTLSGDVDLLTLNSSGALGDGEVGLAYSQSLSASGGVEPYTWSVAGGTLPDGLSLDDETGAISGTPEDADEFSLIVQVADDIGNVASSVFSITIYEELTLLTIALPNAATSGSYSASLESSGGRSPVQWTLVSGSLPSGMSLGGVQNATATVSGMAGSSSSRSIFTVRVSDSLGVSKTTLLQINVVGASSLIGGGANMLMEINHTTAASFDLSGPGLAGFDSIEGLAFDDDNGRLLGSDTETGKLVAVDTSTGVATQIGAIGWNNVRGLAYNTLLNMLYGVDQTTCELISIDRTTGAGTLIGSIGAVDVSSLAFSTATQKLYAVDNGGPDLLEITPSDASVTVVNTLGVYGGVQGLAYDEAGDRLLGVSSDESKLIAIATDDATITDIGAVSGGASLAMDPDSGVLYALSSSDARLSTVDTDDAAFTAVGSVAVVASGLAFDGESLFTVNTTTNELVRLGTGGGSAVTVGALGDDAVIALAYDTANGVLYGSDTDNGQLVTIDTASGEVTAIGSFGAGIDVTALAWDGAVLYGADTNADQLVTIDTNTGTATPASGVFGAGLSDPRGLAFEMGGTALYAADGTSGTLYSVNVSNGSASAIGSTGYLAAGLAPGMAAGELFGLSDRPALLVIDTGGLGESVDSLALDNLTGLAYDSGNDVLYGVDATAEMLYVIDEFSGTSRAVGALGISDIQGLAYGGGVLYGVARTSKELVTIDTNTGAASAVPAVDLSTFTGISGLAYSSTGGGTLYVSDRDGDQLIAIDIGTNGVSVVGGGFGSAMNVEGLGFVGSTLYGVDAQSGRLVVINTGDGSAAFTGTFHIGSLQALTDR
ncbi:MAG: putative Ig domain-containing protein, partial [Planctomycetaceae bacterium]|nr:putative Ig domain-containing protein [Planctomycetaceae bacterium]